MLADARARSQLSIPLPHLLTIGIATLGNGLLIPLLSSGTLDVVARRRR
jgi:F0F1-type ATP synthase membrane subunit c/vacuolar-type H+-ATPase subunit K